MSFTKSTDPVTPREERWYICRHYNISHSSMNKYCRAGWTPEEVLQHFAKERRKGTTAAAAREAGLNPRSVSARMVRTDETREEAIAKMTLRSQSTETYHACLDAGMTKSVALYRAYKLRLSPTQALDYKSRGRCKPVVAFGQEWPSMSELCRRFEVCRTSVERRVKVYGMPLEDAVLAKGSPAKRNCVRVNVLGKMFPSVQEALAHYGVNKDVYGTRREQGWARWTACRTTTPPWSTTVCLQMSWRNDARTAGQ